MPPTIRSASTRPPVRVARPSWFRRRVRLTCLDTVRGRALVIARSLAVKETGRRRWKQMSGYHGQARVENAFFRYTSIIGDGLRARKVRTCLSGLLTTIRYVVGEGLVLRGQPKQGLKGGHRRPPSVAPKDEFVEVVREMFGAHAMMGTPERGGPHGLRSVDRRGAHAGRAPAGSGLLRDRAAVPPRDHRRDPSAAVWHVDGADGPAM